MTIETKPLVLNKNLRVMKIKDMVTVPSFYKEIMKKVISELNDVLKEVSNYQNTAKNLAYIKVYEALFPTLIDDIERKEFLKTIVNKTIKSEELKNTCLEILDTNDLEEASNIINGIVQLDDIKYISLFSEVINDNELKELYTYHVNNINIKLDELNNRINDIREELTSFEEGSNESEEYSQLTEELRTLESVPYNIFFTNQEN